MKKSHQVIRFLASLKLAVVIIAYLAVVIAIGTILESKYDAQAARVYVYDSVWMWIGMGALATSLIAVMVDRWPWKKRHTPFVLAHIGILVILFGGILTMKYGIDGQMIIPLAGENKQVILPNETEILVYASFGGTGMTKLYEQGVNFLKTPPTEKRPIQIPTNEGFIELVDYKPYALPSRQVAAADEAMAGSGLRFQMRNDRVNVIEWLVQRNSGHVATHNFGPAQVHLGPLPREGVGKNEIYLQGRADGKLDWRLFVKDQKKPAKQGVMAEGDLLETGWMGLQFRVLRYLPKAKESWGLKELEAPTPLTTGAVRVRFMGKEQWLLLNDTLRLFSENVGYMVSYLNRRIDLGFPVALKNFEIIPYGGTNRAKEYRSVVDFPDRKDTAISMNEPAVFQGLTFYQASFQTDESGKPTHSVFSVNYDPGRVWKYWGSLIMSLGIVTLFWFRRVFRAGGSK